MFEWQKWPEKISKWMRALILLLEDDDEGECPAEEVIKFQAKNGYFGMSTVPRTPRPKHIQFHVGQVIRHKLWNYRGVIIGWDETMTVWHPCIICVLKITFKCFLNLIKVI